MSEQHHPLFVLRFSCVLGVVLWLVCCAACQKSNSAPVKVRDPALGGHTQVHKTVTSRRAAPRRGRQVSKVRILSVRRRGREVRLRFHPPLPRTPDEWSLARSTSPLPRTHVPVIREAITLARLRHGQTTYLDTNVGEGVRYYYRLYRFKQKTRGHTVVEASLRQSSAQHTVVIPTRRIVGKRLRQPRLVVDKFYYILSLYDASTLVKRYPIALGRNPIHPKGYFDNATTPEGRYHVTYRWPKATYYKALGVSYPTAKNRQWYRKWAQARRRAGKSVAAIGGAIQIHGKGISSNWTFGCIALRNRDMDELFSLHRLGARTPITIHGLHFPKTQGYPVSVYTRLQQQRLHQMRQE